MTITYASPSTHAAQVGAQAFANAYIHERYVQASTQLDALRKPLLTQQDELTKKKSDLQSKINEQISALTTAETNGNPTGHITQKIADLTAQRDALGRQLDDLSTSLRNLDPSKLNPPQLLLPAGLPQDPVSPNMILIGAFGLLVGLALGIALAFLRERLD